MAVPDSSTGARIAAQEIAAGADLLIVGDLGIGNTTPAATLIAALLGAAAAEVTGRGTGIDDFALAHKRAVVDAALARIVAALEAKPAEALRQTQALLRRADRAEVVERMELENGHFAERLTSDEVKKAISAFFTARAPR